jgi:hypothetical protein
VNWEKFENKAFSTIRSTFEQIFIKDLEHQSELFDKNLSNNQLNSVEKRRDFIFNAFWKVFYREFKELNPITNQGNFYLNESGVFYYLEENYDVRKVKSKVLNNSQLPNNNEELKKEYSKTFDQSDELNLLNGKHDSLSLMNGMKSDNNHSNNNNKFPQTLKKIDLMDYSLQELMQVTNKINQAKNEEKNQDLLEIIENEKKDFTQLENKDLQNISGKKLFKNFFKSSNDNNIPKSETKIYKSLCES